MGARKRKLNDCDPSTSLEGPSSVGGPTPKRPKNDPNVEKRLARLKRSCPKNIMERVDRVMTQRFFLIERKRVEGQLREEFKVLGSTGNVYTVIIDKVPLCNCPDATKGNHCKHILFVFLKVLSVPINSSFYYQKALLSTELEDLFANAPAAPNSLSNARVQVAYANAMGRSDETSAMEPKPKEGEHSTTKRRLPKAGDDCPVCYESMHDVDIKVLSFCEECGNSLHTECFKQWARSASLVTCVWCRAKWAVVPNAASGNTHSEGVGTSEGYLNLGVVAGVSPVRDTSSYYDGPRPGQNWGGSHRRSYW